MALLRKALTSMYLYCIYNYLHHSVTLNIKKNDLNRTESYFF